MAVVTFGATQMPDEYGVALLLDKLDPEQVSRKLSGYDRVKARVADLPDSAESYDHFLGLMCEVYDNALQLGRGWPSCPPWYLAQQVELALKGACSRFGGTFGAARHARRGHLHDIAYALVDHLKAEQENAIVTGAIDVAVDQWNFDQCKEVVQVVLERWGPILGKLSARSPADLVICYRELLLTVYNSRKTVTPMVSE